jgi:hypothetical protein
MATVAILTALADGCWVKNFQGSMVVVLPNAEEHLASLNDH